MTKFGLKVKETLGCLSLGRSLETKPTAIAPSTCGSQTQAGLLRQRFRWVLARVKGTVPPGCLFGGVVYSSDSVFYIPGFFLKRLHIFSYISIVFDLAYPFKKKLSVPK